MRILPFAGMQIRLDASASDEQALTMSTHSPDKQGDPLDPQAQEKEKILTVSFPRGIPRNKRKIPSSNCLPIGRENASDTKTNRSVKNKE